METVNPTLREVFDTLDTEGNGYIEIEHFVDKFIEFFNFEEDIGTDSVKELLSDILVSKNGRIEFEDFNKCFQTVIEKQGQPVSRHGSFSTTPDTTEDFDVSFDERRHAGDGGSREDEFYESHGSGASVDNNYLAHNRQRPSQTSTETVNSSLHQYFTDGSSTPQPGHHEHCEEQHRQTMDAMETVSRDLEGALRRQDELEQERYQLKRELDEAKIRNSRDREERQTFLNKIHTLEEHCRDTDAHCRELLEGKDRKTHQKLEKISLRHQEVVEKHKERISSLENQINQLEETNNDLESDLELTNNAMAQQREEHMKIMENAINDLGTASHIRIQDLEKQRDEALQNVSELELTLGMLESEAANLAIFPSNTSTPSTVHSNLKSATTGDGGIVSPVVGDNDCASEVRSRGVSLSGELEVLVQQLTGENRRLQTELMEVRMELANQEVATAMAVTGRGRQLATLGRENKENGEQADVMSFAEERAALGETELREALKSEQEAVADIQGYLNRVLMLVVEYCPEILGKISQSR